MLIHVVSSLLAACVSSPENARHAGSRATPEGEALPGGGDSEAILDERVFFADTGVLTVGIELSSAAIEELAGSPDEYVAGAMTLGEERFEGVGVRLKGSSTYQWLDGKPAWKLKFDEFEPGVRVHGLERLTLDSNYWDGVVMA